jgi:AcrR family transcriptional regulator
MGKSAAKHRTRLAPEERRSLILDCTAELIARDGIAALTIERIGQEADISKSLVYNYFANMQALLSELLERELRRLRWLQGEAAKRATTFEGLVRGVTHVYLKYIDERGLIIERLQHEPTLSAMHDPTEYGRDAAVDYLANIVMRHFNFPEEVAHAATEISFGLPATAGAYLLRRTMSRQALEDMTVTMILGSILTLQREYVGRQKLLE